MLGEPCSQHVTGNTSRQNQPQSAIIAFKPQWIVWIMNQTKLPIVMQIKLVWHCNVMTWKHFPQYWPFVRRNHRWPADSRHKRPVTRGFDIFIVNLNKILSYSHLLQIVGPLTTISTLIQTYIYFLILLLRYCMQFYSALPRVWTETQWLHRHICFINVELFLR